MTDGMTKLRLSPFSTMLVTQDIEAMCLNIKNITTCWKFSDVNSSLDNLSYILSLRLNNE